MTELFRNKVIIPLSECRPGMKLLQPIVDIATGNVIVSKDQILTADIIRKLDNFQPNQVWIELTSEESIWKVPPETMKKYEDYAQILKSIMTSYRDDVIKLELLFEVAEGIIKDFECSFELLACINLIKDKEKDIYKHSLNVAFLSLLMGRWQGEQQQALGQIVSAALLHDIGKLDMPMQVSNKKILSIKEKIQYRRHPIYSYERLRKYKELDIETLKGILTHHERCDGSGFPLNLKEDRINNIGKIVGLADEYERLKSKYHMFKVIEILSYDKAEQFDGSLLQRFCVNVANYYIGTYVLLSTGEVAEILLIHSRAIYRPLVKVGERSIELNEYPDINIEKVY